MRRLALLLSLAGCASTPPKPAGHQAATAIELCIPACALIGRPVAGMVIDALKRTYDCACVLLPGEVPTRVPIKPEAL